MFYRSAQVPRTWPGFDKMDLPEKVEKFVRRIGDWTGVHVVQLTCSRDLKEWKRLGNRQPFIGPSRRDSGAYDTLMVGCPTQPIVRGDEIWFYYAGAKSYAYTSLSKTDHQGAVCLAVLRRDGFISLDAGEKRGTILTKPFRVPGKKLFVNVDAPRGELRVEALDEAGKGVATSAPLKGDHRRAEVEWQAGDISDHHGKVVSLRFTLRNAQFYSYWITP